MTKIDFMKAYMKLYHIVSATTVTFCCFIRAFRKLYFRDNFQNRLDDFLFEMNFELCVSISSFSFIRWEPILYLSKGRVR